MLNSPKGVEYDEMVELALELLMDYEIYDFPLNLDLLAQKLNIKLMKYSEFDKKEFRFLVKKSPSGFTIKKKDINSYVKYDLLYNDINDNEARNRFTIAHEIGHIMKEHFGESVNENDETLCDYFAKCLLAPQCLIISRKEFDIDTIITNYNVSRTVAANWLEAINNRMYYGKDCLSQKEKEYLKRIKKYHNP